MVFSLNPPCLSVGKNYLDCTTKMNVIEEQSLTNKYFLWQGFRPRKKENGNHGFVNTEIFKSKIDFAENNMLRNKLKACVRYLLKT